MALAVAPQLGFAVEDAARVEYAAAPTLRFALRIDSDAPVRSMLLDTQIQIAARRRGYDETAHERLFELFGPTSNWASSLRTLLWTRTTLIVPAFADSTVAHLDVPCSYDLSVVASRYFDALSDGTVPLEFLFSGSVFASGSDGLIQITRISWEQEAAFDLPVATWKQTMEAHFPGTAWIRVDKDDFDRLAAYRARHALASWSEVLDRLGV